MFVFDEGWNRRELWKKSEGKMVNSAISGQNRTLVPIPNKGGTGTTDAAAKTKEIPVPPSRTGLVPVPNKVVPLPLVPTALVFGIFA